LQHRIGEIHRPRVEDMGSSPRLFATAAPENYGMNVFERLTLRNVWRRPRHAICVCPKIGSNIAVVRVPARESRQAVTDREIWNWRPMLEAYDDAQLPSAALARSGRRKIGARPAGRTESRIGHEMIEGRLRWSGFPLLRPGGTANGSVRERAFGMAGERSAAHMVRQHT
jgi:hypothetical protein